MFHDNMQQFKGLHRMIIQSVVTGWELLKKLRIKEKGSSNFIKIYYLHFIHEFHKLHCLMNVVTALLKLLTALLEYGDSHTGKR